MRKMFLLQGAPGAGKISFLREHGLTEHAVGFDMVRELLSGPHPTLDDGVEGATRRIGGDVTKLAIEFAETAVRMRCARGETVFVDTVCASSKDVQRWEKIARDYDYEVILVDVQGSITDDELLARNASRPAVDRMGDEVVLRHAARVRSSRDSGAVTARTIAPGEVEAELIVPTLDFTGYNRVLVVGDVQGCGTALDALVEKVNPGENDAVVFVGDLFDRGIENDRVYHTVQDLRRRTAVHKVSGNHCRHLIECIKHTASGRYAGTRESIRQMVEAGILAGDLLDLYRSMVPYITARFADDAELWITHGGVVGLDAHRVDESPALPMGGYRTGLLPDRFFEYGSSRQDAVHADKGDYSTEIDEVFAERYADHGILAFHGHRATAPSSGGAGPGPQPGHLRTEAGSPVGAAQAGQDHQSGAARTASRLGPGQGEGDRGRPVVVQLHP